MITGGGGFIGRFLVQAHLDKGDTVKILTRDASKVKYRLPNIVLVQGDLSKPETIKSKYLDELDILYHCAAEIHDPDKMHAVNVEGTARLVEVASGRIQRWVQLSSVGAYGPVRNGVITENSPESPLGPYELTKTQSDNIVKESGLPYTILRPSNVFGETMNNTSLWQMLGMINKRLFFYLGKSGALMNYVYVQDVVNALMLLGKNDGALGNIYNLSQCIEIEKAIDALCKGLNCSRKILRLPEVPIRVLTSILENIPGFPLSLSRINALTCRCYYDSSKITHTLGFEFESELESSLAKFASSSI